MDLISATGVHGTERTDQGTFRFTVGDKYDMWAKIMKDKRFGGPFREVPFPRYIQSPIGLVPKAGGKTRLIFHLSYNFSERHKDQSVNSFIPRDLCSVRYNDLDAAVQACLGISRLAVEVTGSGYMYVGKSDFLSAFHQVPLNQKSWFCLILAAEDPRDKKLKFFVDKCLPFGASISCAIYQKFSDAIKHALCYRITITCVINYLDDFLFIQYMIEKCNELIRSFLKLCAYINLPVAHEKTEWAAETVVFLGNLLDGRNLMMSIPIEKKNKAVRLLNEFADKRKSMVCNLQVLTGYLNFLSHAIFAGRAFTRRIYVKYSGTKVKKLKQYHHIALDEEFKFDLQVWQIFLTHYQSRAICRPMVDLEVVIEARQLNFASDASATRNLGFRTVFDKQWICKQWEPGYIDERNHSPSVAYLELYALTAAVITWGSKLRNCRVVVYCDNMAAVQMVNQSTSSCKNCMHLI